MKNAIIFHGSGNDHSGNWFPWLKIELEKSGYIVWVPDMPNSETPDKEAYLKTVFTKNWNFDKDTVLVGHSSGATFILRLLEKLPENIKIKKAILVAAPINKGTIPEYFKYKESMVSNPFDWDKIKNSCEKFYYVCSDNDPYQCGVDQAKIIQQNLGGEIILRKGEGHFNLESGPQYHKLPLILDLLS